MGDFEEEMKKELEKQGITPEYLLAVAKKKLKAIVSDKNMNSKKKAKLIKDWGDRISELEK